MIFLPVSSYISPFRQSSWPLCLLHLQLLLHLYKRRWGGGLSQMGAEGQKVQPSSHRVNKSWDVKCNMVTTVNHTILHI